MINILQYVTKADGTKEKFEKEKIVQTCMNIDLDQKTSQDIADYIEKTLPDGSSTHKVYETIMAQLESKKVKTAPLFTLRESIADIDSTSFELYTQKILEADGYKCKWNQLMQGASVEHQIDVLAEKNGEIFIVECKRHFNPHRFCGLDVALQVEARLEDIMNGFSSGRQKVKVSGAWIFTNAKFSEHSKMYCKSKNIRMTGWRSGEFGLEEMIKRSNTYPVTILKVDLTTKAALMHAGMLTLRDVIQTGRSNIPNFPDVMQQAKSLIKM